MKMKEIHVVILVVGIQNRFFSPVFLVLIPVGITNLFSFWMIGLIGKQFIQSNTIRPFLNLYLHMEMFFLRFQTLDNGEWKS